MEEKVKIEMYVKALEGISYHDWARVRYVIELLFKDKLNEAKKTVYFEKGEDSSPHIKHIFGGM